MHLMSIVGVTRTQYSRKGAKADTRRGTLGIRTNPAFSLFKSIQASLKLWVKIMQARLRATWKRLVLVVFNIWHGKNITFSCMYLNNLTGILIYKSPNLCCINNSWAFHHVEQLLLT